MKKIYFDIGGTNIEYIISVNGKEDKKDFPVNNMDKNALLVKLSEIIDELDSEVELGFSSPTGVDQKTGFCAGESGIKNYGNFNLYEELKSKVQKSKIINIQAINDGNAALLGIIYEEFKNKKPSSAVMIALGTGIGGAIYIDGKLFPGVNNLAGEFGYPMWDDKLNISQALSPVNNFKRINKDKSGKEIIESHNDKNIDSEINKWLKGISKFLSLISFFINPEVIVFNGGVTKNKKFQDMVLNAYSAYLHNNNLENLSQTKIKFFSSNKNYSLLGAKSIINQNNK